MTLSGLIVLLYAFTHSYFGVGSLKNAFGGMHVAGAERVFALVFGLCWVSLFAGGLLLVLKQRSGLFISRAASGGSAVILLTGTMLFWKSGASDMNFLLFTLARPVYGFFLFAVLPQLTREAGSIAPVKTKWILATLGLGAALPWIAALAVRASDTGAVVSFRNPGLFITLFMSLWSLLPFVVLLLVIRAWPRPSERVIALAGGFTGTAVASLYCYGLIWLQQGNHFIMALLPPVVFAGQAIGISAALLYVFLFVKDPL